MGDNAVHDYDTTSIRPDGGTGYTCLVYEGSYAHQWCIDNDRTFHFITE